MCFGKFVWRDWRSTTLTSIHSYNTRIGVFYPLIPTRHLYSARSGPFPCGTTVCWVPDTQKPSWPTESRVSSPFRGSSLLPPFTPYVVYSDDSHFVFPSTSGLGHRIFPSRPGWHCPGDRRPSYGWWATVTTEASCPYIPWHYSLTVHCKLDCPTWHSLTV